MFWNIVFLLLVIFVVWIIIKFIKRFKESNKIYHYLRNYYDLYYYGNDLAPKFMRKIINKEFIEKEDHAIIDISGLSYKIPKNEVFINTSMSSNKSSQQQGKLINPKNGVPKWEFRYIYYYAEITQATPRQKEFYSFFRENFLKNRYVDVKGNINYLSVLVHDLMRSYRSYQDIDTLEANFQRVAENYPDVKDHVNNIIKRLKEKEQHRLKDEEQRRLLAERLQSFTGYHSYYADRRLGAAFKDKLKLSKEEVEFLNNISYYSNPFFGVEFISLEIVKLFLATVKELKEKYKKERKNIDEVVNEVSEVITRKHFNFRTGSQNFQMSMRQTPQEIYKTILTMADNAIRERYNYKKRLTITSYKPIPQVELETKILNKAEKLLSELVLTVKPLSSEADKQLFNTDTQRWKIKYEELKTDLEKKTISSEEFLKEFVALSLLNENNLVSHRNMFFDAAKYMTFQDKETAICLYIYYLFYNMGVETKIKTLTKKEQKELFQNKEQETKFEEIKNQLLKDTQLKAALEKVSSIYYVERKKIKLDIASIKEVQQSHSETVEILNEYLKDEKEQEKPKKEIKKEVKTEVKKEIPKIKTKKETQKSTKKAETKNETKTQSTTNYLPSLQLTDLQKTVLDYFAKNNFSISQQAFEKIATQNGTFKNQLLESINEKCYEILDDVLIEEEENYTIYQVYYQKLIIL
jgi:hypothetical protein